MKTFCCRHMSLLGATMFILSAMVLGTYLVRESAVASAASSQAYRTLQIHMPEDVLSLLLAEAKRHMFHSIEDPGLATFKGDRYTKIAALTRKGRRKYHRALSAAGLLVLLSVAYATVISVATRNPRAIAQALCVVSTSWLIVAIFAPTMSIIIKQHVPFIGQAVLLNDTKSIAGLIRSLRETGNWSTASLLFVFGILTPAAKLISLILSLDCRIGRIGPKLARFGHWLAPWAMGDVFALGIVLAFLSFRGNRLTNARLELGYYFFVGQALLLIAASIMAIRTSTSRPQ